LSYFKEQIEAHKEIGVMIDSSFKNGKEFATIFDFKQTILEENSEPFIYVRYYFVIYTSSLFFYLKNDLFPKIL